MSQPSFNWQKYGTRAQLAQPAWLATYGSETQQWVKNFPKTASVAAPDCRLGKT